jgi:CxxC motif-containing protein (DUF1111 family)
VGGNGIQVETHSSAFVGGTCDDFEEINGGAVKQDSVTPALRAALGIDEEPLPAGVTGAGRRTTPDVFGFGLLEAVPDDEILRRADPDDRDHDGISGRANLTEEGAVGRFGRKANAGDLVDFIQDAFLYEQGITSPEEPEEETVVGTPIPPGVDPAPDPEINAEQMAAAVAFVRFLAPVRARERSRDAREGRRLFFRIGCDGCHTPNLRTGPHPVRALRFQVVEAYSDLLLHDMGPALADICRGEATPSEFRTEPLMGLRFVDLLLHDGRAATIAEAIRLHGGEAARSRNRFLDLRRGDRSAVLTFLRSL